MAALGLASPYRLHSKAVSRQGNLLPHPACKLSIAPYYEQTQARQRLNIAANNLVCQAGAAASPLVETATPNAKKAPLLPFRVGHGFDLHRLEPNLPLIIGGVNIPHDRGCEAHSDGDVLLHCVVDAILGALGLPDIGQLFPDNDPKWKGAASSVFVKEAVLETAWSPTSVHVFPSILQYESPVVEP
ncbi:hypothetical protein L7F22_013130 [Adiantum nelumboides]|nr:hypothetical protein [Adiantum nelumboides]